MFGGGRGSVLYGSSKSTSKSAVSGLKIGFSNEILLLDNFSSGVSLDTENDAIVGVFFETCFVSDVTSSITLSPAEILFKKQSIGLSLRHPIFSAPL